MKKPYSNYKTGKQCRKEASEEMKHKTIAAYQTSALNDSYVKEKETNISLTSDEGVIEAKKWVDENHK